MFAGVFPSHSQVPLSRIEKNESSYGKNHIKFFGTYFFYSSFIYLISWVLIIKKKTIKFEFNINDSNFIFIYCFFIIFVLNLQRFVIIFQKPILSKI
jgi:hypothetical protein